MRTAPAGITTVTGTPAARPAHAYACPAFPAESVIAPRSRASGASVAIRFVIPRALNDPVFWRCSALRYSRSSRIEAPVADSGPGGGRRRGQDRRAVDEARQSVGGGPDVPERDVELGLGARVDLGHAAEYRTAYARS